MDYYNNPDNKLLNMHLCLDHVLTNYVFTNYSFKYNLPKKFELWPFKEVLIKNYQNTINGWNSIYLINHDYTWPTSKFN